MSNENLGDLIARIQNLRDSLKETRMALGMLELEAIQLMDAGDQVAYEDTKHSVRIPVKREYDVHKFASVMGEILTPEQFNEVYSPAHEVTKQVPASVNGVKAKRLFDQGLQRVGQRSAFEILSFRVHYRHDCDFIQPVRA